MNRRFLAVTLFAAVLLVVAGCGGSSGPAVAPVTGSVTLDGAALPNAMVTFVPDGGGPAATGQTDAGGKYSLSTAGKKGAVLGKHKVKVTSLQTQGAATELQVSPDTYGQKSSGDYAQESQAQSVQEKIPEKYNTQSELTFDVVSGENTYDIPMTSK
jgi:hypothetical protein